MTDSPETHALSHRAHMFAITTRLILLESGIQVDAAKSLRQARSIPGVMMWRQFVCIMIFANFPGLSRFEATPRSMARLAECAMALRQEFNQVWDIDTIAELMKLEREIDLPMLTVLLPSAAQQRALNRYRSRQ